MTVIHPILITHLMLNEDEKYIKRYVDLILNNTILFDDIAHTFLFSDQDKGLGTAPKSDNIKHVYIDYMNNIKYPRIKRFYLNIRDAMRIKNISKNSDKIILHSLHGPLSYQLFFILFPKFLKKTYLVTWGAELYKYHLLKKIKTRDRVSFMMRKLIFKKIFGIITPNQREYERAKELYNTKARRFDAFYPNPVDFSLFDQLHSPIRTDDFYTILLGNSASETNEHFEAIDFFTSIKDNFFFNVLCPLSYGDKEYAKKVVTYGKEKLGDRFEPLLDWVEPEKYAHILATVDIAIMNHKRQQAVGNIIPLLFAGKKVYIRKSVTTYSFLEGLEIKVYDTETLMENKNGDSFFKFEPQLMKKNKEIIREYYSEEHCAELWHRIFISS